MQFAYGQIVTKQIRNDSNVQNLYHKLSDWAYNIQFLMTSDISQVFGLAFDEWVWKLVVTV